jgi:hypothetical protein
MTVWDMHIEPSLLPKDMRLLIEVIYHRRWQLSSDTA